MDLFDEAKKLMEENRRTTEGHQYTVPSAEHYPYQWLWDSCFHAIILAHIDPEAAKAELRSLFAKQFEDGMIPHIIYWKPGILHLFRWGVEGTSSLTQPPMLAYAAWEVHARAPDQSFLESIYPGLMRYYRFLIDKRDPRDHHLIGIINPDESGEDDSPRFDVPLQAPLNVSYKEHLALREKLVDDNTACNFDAEMCMRQYFWVKDVPFQSVLIENLRVLAKIARLLGREDEARYAELNADLISQAMRERLFEDGVYWSAFGVDYQKLKVHTWAHFSPLFAGLYSPEEAETLVRTRLTSEDEFAAPWGMRTVSRKEPAYRPEGNGNFFSWRGPVWMVPQWFVHRGLVRYGFLAEARDLREKARALIERSGFRECFNPETGDGEGAKGFTWGCLVIDMFADDAVKTAQ